MSYLPVALRDRLLEADNRHCAYCQTSEVLHIRALKALAWQGVDWLIQTSKATACDKAVEMVRQLWKLALYQEKEGAFRERLNQIYK